MKIYRPFFIFIACAISVFLNIGLANAQLYQTKAKQALLLDAETGTVLFSKEADAQIPPASLAKIMTVEVIFNQLKTGRLNLDDKFFVSENAWRKGGASSGGSTMFAKLNSEISLESLLKGIMIQSANDGSIIVAEGLSGTEDIFATIMNERARSIGLINSNFVNATGLPQEGQYVSIRDLAKLASYVIKEYPDLYKFYQEPAFEWNKINQRNRNPLLKMDIGADGMKTGFTEASGYAIVGSAIRNDQRLIAVLSGMESKKQRAEEARKILDWGFRAFEKFSLFDENEVLGQANVYGGKSANVDLVGKGGVKIYLPIANRDKLKARIVYNGPLMPPVEKGDKVAKLQISLGGDLSQEIDLYAAETIEKGGIQRQSIDALKELLFGWL